MKNQLQKYLDMGCRLTIHLINGKQIQPNTYSNIEVFENCFVENYLNETCTIYPYSSIFKIEADITIPL